MLEPSVTPLVDRWRSSRLWNLRLQSLSQNRRAWGPTPSSPGTQRRPHSAQRNGRSSRGGRRVGGAPPLVELALAVSVAEPARVGPHAVLARDAATAALRTTERPTNLAVNQLGAAIGMVLRPVRAARPGLPRPPFPILAVGRAVPGVPGRGDELAATDRAGAGVAFSRSNSLERSSPRGPSGPSPPCVVMPSGVPMECHGFGGLNRLGTRRNAYRAIVAAARSYHDWFDVCLTVRRTLAGCVGIASESGCEPLRMDAKPDGRCAGFAAVRRYSRLVGNRADWLSFPARAGSAALSASLLRRSWRQPLTGVCTPFVCSLDTQTGIVSVRDTT